MYPVSKVAIPLPPELVAGSFVKLMLKVNVPRGEMLVYGDVCRRM